jgi:hypothetical protein
VQTAQPFGNRALRRINRKTQRNLRPQIDTSPAYDAIMLIPGEAAHPFRDIVAPRFREIVAY